MKLFPFFNQKTLLIFSLFLLSITFLNAQNKKTTAPKDKSAFWEKVRFGGGIGGGLTTGGFNLSVSPTAVYDFNTRFSLGLGVNGIYSESDTFSSTLVGISAIGLYNPTKTIQFSIDFLEQHVNRTQKSNSKLNENYWYPALFVGAGYRTKNVTFGVRYDLLYDEETSVFPRAWVPFVRVFF